MWDDRHLLDLGLRFCAEKRTRCILDYTGSGLFAMGPVLTQHRCVHALPPRHMWLGPRSTEYPRLGLVVSMPPAYFRPAIFKAVCRNAIKADVQVWGLHMTRPWKAKKSRSSRPQGLKRMRCLNTCCCIFKMRLLCADDTDALKSLMSRMGSAPENSPLRKVRASQNNRSAFKPR